MRLRILRHEEHRRMPWRNGAGTTYEVARGPQSTGSAEFDWRISIADVAGSGPFSAYSGVDRTILLLSGEWMALTVDGTRHVLSPRVPFRFSGDSEVCSEVPGPTRDLNVMTRRGRAASSVAVLQPAGALQVAGGHLQVLVCLTGAVRLVAPAEPEAELTALDAALWRGPDPLTVDGAGAVAAIRIQPKEAS